MFQTDKYGPILKFKAAWDFHFISEERNDYSRILEDNKNFKYQSFRWDTKKGDEEENSDGKNSINLTLAIFAYELILFIIHIKLFEADI